MARLKINGHSLVPLRLVFHGLGLSCLGGAVFLQSLVFKDIALKGYFIGVEGNPAILSLEVGLTAFSFIYLLHLFASKLRAIH